MFKDYLDRIYKWILFAIKHIYEILLKIIKYLFIEKADEKNSSTYNTIKNILIALVVAVIIRSFLFEPFYIPSGSMKPGLLEGDYIFVSKYDYGYSRYSFPFGLPLFSDRIFYFNYYKKPNRGDVLVFRLPSNPKINYIKRLIGLPGDKIQMKDGVLYINDEKISKEYIGDALEYEFNEKTKVKKYKEVIEGKEFEVFDKFGNGDGDNTNTYYIPKQNYFFMGDNRDNSIDSRFIATGLVPEENLIGQARMIFLSSRENPLKFWKWHKIIRFNRIFKKIR